MSETTYVPQRLLEDWDETCKNLIQSGTLKRRRETVKGHYERHWLWKNCYVSKNDEGEK